MALQVVSVCAFLVCMISVAFAGGYGSGGGGSGGGGGGGGGSGGGGGGGGSSGPSSINAAVISKHVFKIKKFASSSEQAQIPTIIIGAGNVALPIKMLSSSSDVQISQEHNNAGPQTMNSNSVDGTIVLNQFVKKPILQNVREVIIPQRKIVQEVMPVKEFIKTIVAQEDSSSSGGGGGGGSSGGSGTSAPDSDDSY